MIIGSVLLVVSNCGVLAFPIFYIIQDSIKAKLPSPESPQLQPQPQQEETQKILQEIQPKIIINSFGSEQKTDAPEFSEKPSSRNENSEVCSEFTNEIKIGKLVYHAKKESVDNFSLMQSSGSILLSPLNTRSNLVKQLTLLPTLRKNELEKIDSPQRTPGKKKIEAMRFNMQQLIVDDLKGMEKTDFKGTMTETMLTASSTRTQGDNESENLIADSKFNKIIPKGHEE